jgi:hypothetical protein
VVLFAAIFAFQAFAFRPQPTQLDALVIGPLALITFALYEPPLAPLKADSQGVSDFDTRLGLHAVVLSHTGVYWQKLVGDTATTGSMATTHTDYSQYPIFVQDLLLLTSEPGVHGCSNGIWSSHQLARVDIGW